MSLAVHVVILNLNMVKRCMETSQNICSKAYLYKILLFGFWNLIL